MRISNDMKSEFVAEVIESISMNLEYVDNVHLTLAVKLLELRDYLTDCGQTYKYAMELTTKVANYFYENIKNEEDLNEFWDILDGECWKYECGELYFY